MSGFPGDRREQHSEEELIRPLVHPEPVIAVHMSKAEEEPPPNTDVVLAGPTDFDAATARILESSNPRRIETPRRLGSGNRGQAGLSILDLANNQTGRHPKLL
jgi:hypothetical protein